MDRKPKTTRADRRQANLAQKKENKKLRKLIRTGNDPILSTVCEAIEPTSDRAKAIAHKMLKVTLAMDNGVGLAAPQIGENARIVLIWSDRFRRHDSEGFVMVNPTVIGRSQAVDVQIEGCLSYPGKQVLVSRFRSIDVKWFDLSGKEQWRTFDGWEARVVQHECEHLDGVCRVGHANLDEPVLMEAPAKNGMTDGTVRKGPHIEQKSEPGVRPMRRFTPSPSRALLTAAALGAFALPPVSVR